MKERIIRFGVLTIVFIAALNVFSFLTNQGNADMTANMNSASLPTISFMAGDSEINLLAGHVNEMKITAVRDTVTPLDANGNIQANINVYEEKITSLSYEVCTLDGEETLLDKKEETLTEDMTFQIGDVFEENEEGVLKITLNLDEENEVYYYTRIMDSEKLYLEQCLDYVKDLHSNMLKGENTDQIKKVMESDASGDNTTLQHVNIYSDLEHATWGDLRPEIVSQVRCEVKETKEAYTSILLSYRVQCVGDNNPEELFDVKEFFKVRYVEGTFYLLSYDRQLTEVFDGSNVVLMSKGINLGLTTDSAQYKVNQDGTIVAFVQNNELWCYNKNEDEFSLVFSFSDAESNDIRNYFDNHSVKILSMEESGNITFGVYGYMNRGDHEGESGAAIYYFKLGQNAVEEKAFIPSVESRVMIEQKLGELAYYNDETGILYVLAEGILHKIHLETGQDDILLEGLKNGQYVSSEDGHQIAYKKNENGTEVEVLNFLEGTTQTIQAEAEEVVQPLGFVLRDFVYGVSKQEDTGKTSSGETVSAMYKVEIRDSKNEIVKTYQVDGMYILDAIIESNMITLERAVKQNGIYSGVSEDYITNNEENVSSVVLKSYWTNLKETQYRLVFEDGIDNKKAKVLSPKHLLHERDTVLAFEHGSDKDMYAVYGLGELAGLYTEAGDAIQKAEEISGVVLSPGQRYIWEDGNRVAWYRNFEIGAFSNQSKESSLAACIRVVLAYEEKQVDVQSELQTKTPVQVINENLEGEAILFKNCSAKDMFYLIDKGIPVIAMTDSSNAILMIGYDAVTVTYIDPNSGAIRIKDIEKVDEMMAASGNIFLAYVK